MGALRNVFLVIVDFVGLLVIVYFGLFESIKKCFFFSYLFRFVSIDECFIYFLVFCMVFGFFVVL